MDTYFDTNKCVERLFEEWKKHPKLIIACDFDDTVFDCHRKGHNFDKVFDLLKECKQLEFYVVIFTAGKIERYPFITQYMEDHGVKIDGINQNPIPLPYGNNVKIYANIFLDDRAGLFQAATILLMLINKIKSQTK